MWVKAEKVILTFKVWCVRTEYGNLYMRRGQRCTGHAAGFPDFKKRKALWRTPTTKRRRDNRVRKTTILQPSNNWFGWNYLWTVKLSKSLHTGHLIIIPCSALRWSLADTTWTKGSTAKKQTDWRHVMHGREGNPSLMERYHHRSISWPNRRKHQTNPKGDLPQNWPVLFKSVNVRDKGRTKNYSDERKLKRCDHWGPCMISNWILDEGKLCSEGHYWDNW